MKRLSVFFLAILVFGQATASHAAELKLTASDAFAILKVSYNRIGETPVTGGICGTAFFIDEYTALTANHVLNRLNYKPNDGYKRCQYWLISQTNVIIPIERENLRDHPEIDTTFIAFDEPQSSATVLKLADIPPTIGEAVLSNGYVGNRMPDVKASWAPDRLIIENCDLRSVIADREGFVKSIKTLTVNAKDIKLSNVTVAETSFSGIVGMSGGPLIRKSSNEVIGLMSIGLPPEETRYRSTGHDASEKRTLFAISVEEIKKVRKLNASLVYIRVTIKLFIAILRRLAVK